MAREGGIGPCGAHQVLRGAAELRVDFDDDDVAIDGGSDDPQPHKLADAVSEESGVLVIVDQTRPAI